MSIPSRFLRLLRAEVNHRLGKSGRSEYRPYDHPEGSASDSGGAAWEDVGNSNVGGSRTRAASAAGVDPTLAAHYRALELPYGADLGSVRAAYKRLMKLYHPDRYQDPEKRATATEVVKRLNAAYGELVRHLERQGEARA